MSANSERPLRPTHRLLVKLGYEGVQLLTPLMAQAMVLGHHELEALVALNTEEHTSEESLISSLKSRLGASQLSLGNFIGMLRRSRRLRARAKTPRLVPLAGTAALDAADSIDPDKIVSIKWHQTLRLNGDKFELVNHDGELVESFTAAELSVIGHYLRPCTLAAGLQAAAEALPDVNIDEQRIGKILARLDAANLLDEHEATGEAEVNIPEPPSRKKSCKVAFARQAQEQDAREAERREKTGVTRPMVIPVSYDEGVPAALGMIVAYAKAYEDGRLDEFYDFRLDWFWDEDRLPGFTERPAIYLFSNYLWSHEGCIGASERIKQRSPGSITIHGGPDTPKYPEDSENYFKKYPHVDIVVRGEGEATAADTLDKLQSVIGQENPDLSVLAGVPGITYRHNGEIIRNPDRDRIMDLDTIPSPYIEGLFDAYQGVPRLHVTLETNRGCPYGCTFCDWGSATTSKIRKFDLERVFGEIEWCSEAKIQSVSVADANFGVFERDVQIAERVAKLKTTTGYPEAFGGSYAKNSTKYLQQIIKVMAEADILAQGVLSLQTMDADTLTAIKRSNIKVEKYDALANEMRQSNLQLTVELMMGLPGATLKGFVEDLQQCIDRDIQARVNHTTMLVNSPMNNPEYRAEHQIETGQELGPGKMPVLVSTRTYTRDDMDKMLAIRLMFMMADNFGMLRLVSRFVRQQSGMDEMAFYQKLMETHTVDTMQLEYPVIAAWVAQGDQLMAPVYSWALFMTELREFLVKECKVPDDSALDTVMAAQLSMLPAQGREYPCKVELAHDVAAWHEQMLAAKAAGHWKDWQLTIPPLSEFGPATLDVGDFDGFVTRMLGCDIEMSSNGVNWDMDSRIARASVHQDFNPAYYKEADIIGVG